jgi:hypothetical protein
MVRGADERSEATAMRMRAAAFLKASAPHRRSPRSRVRDDGGAGTAAPRSWSSAAATAARPCEVHSHVERRADRRDRRRAGRRIRLVPAVESRAWRQQRRSADITMATSASRNARREIVRDTATAVDTDSAASGSAAARNCRTIASSCPRCGVPVGTRFPALDNAARARQILHAWKAGPQTVALRRQLEAMPGRRRPMPFRFPWRRTAARRSRTSARARSPGTSAG